MGMRQGYRISGYRISNHLDVAQEMSKEQIRAMRYGSEGKDYLWINDTRPKLSAILSICASCKRIRDDSGGWNQIEAYIRDHSETEFSHGICPECAKKPYPELDC